MTPLLGSNRRCNFDAFIDEASVNGAWPDLYPEEEFENPFGDDEDDEEETVEP